jgi:hypothetical protein
MKPITTTTAADVISPLDLSNYEGTITTIEDEQDDEQKILDGQKARIRLTGLTMHGPEQDPEWVDKTWGSYEAYQSMEAVIKLTDESFEHDTQASSGMTTGPWFVLFSASYCSHCFNMISDWTQLAIDLKGEVNIALVDCPFNPLTTKRFNITKFPTMYYLHKKKMYEYPPNKSRYWRDLALFARGEYETTPELEIPPPHTSFDELIENTQNFINSIILACEHDPWGVFVAVMGGFGFVSLFPLLYVIRHGFVWDTPQPLFPQRPPLQSSSSSSNNKSQNNNTGVVSHDDKKNSSTKETTSRNNKTNVIVDPSLKKKE